MSSASSEQSAACKAARVKPPAAASEPKNGRVSTGGCQSGSIWRRLHPNANRDFKSAPTRWRVRRGRAVETSTKDHQELLSEPRGDRASTPQRTGQRTVFGRRQSAPATVEAHRHGTQKLKVPATRIDHLVKKDDPALLAKLLEELLAKESSPRCRWRRAPVLVDRRHRRSDVRFCHWVASVFCGNPNKANERWPRTTNKSANCAEKISRAGRRFRMPGRCDGRRPGRSCKRPA